MPYFLKKHCLEKNGLFMYYFAHDCIKYKNQYNNRDPLQSNCPQKNCNFGGAGKSPLNASFMPYLLKKLKRN